MTLFGVMRLMLPYDQWRWTVSWVPTCIRVFLLEGSGLLRIVYMCNSIHYTHRKLIMHILIELVPRMSKKLNVP